MGITACSPCSDSESCAHPAVTTGAHAPPFEYQPAPERLALKEASEPARFAARRPPLEEETCTRSRSRASSGCRDDASSKLEHRSKGLVVEFGSDGHKFSFGGSSPSAGAAQVQPPSQQSSSAGGAQNQNGFKNGLHGVSQREQDQYQVTLTKGEQDALGLDLEVHKNEDGLLVGGVYAGLVVDWNVAHAERSVRPGDTIVQVNNVHGNAREMLAELRKPAALPNGSSWTHVVTLRREQEPKNALLGLPRGYLEEHLEDVAGGW